MRIETRKIEKPKTAISKKMVPIFHCSKFKERKLKTGISHAHIFSPGRNAIIHNKPFKHDLGIVRCSDGNVYITAWGDNLTEAEALAEHGTFAYVGNVWEKGGARTNFSRILWRV